jgi:hypothetical protein
MKEKKKKLSYEEKLANAEKILAGKQFHPNGRERFEKALKKAVKSVKQPDSK